MIVFWSVGALLAAAALLLLLRPLVFSHPKENLSRREANISIYRDQLRERAAKLLE